MKPLAVLLLAPAIVLAFSGCSAPDLDKAACQDFAQYVRDGQPYATRAEVLKGIGNVPDQVLQDRMQVLRSVQNDRPSSARWRLALDMVGDRCLHLNAERGWSRV